jgi:spore coat protein U-like protein
VRCLRLRRATEGISAISDFLKTMTRSLACLIWQDCRRRYRRKAVRQSWVSAATGVAFVLALQSSASAQTCTVTDTVMAFGTNVDVLAGAAVDTTSTLQVICSGGSGGAGGQRICINIGAGSASDATSRQLTGPGGNKARFDLYQDAGRTTLWGSWQTGFDTGGVQLEVARNTTTNVTVFGRFFGSQQTAVAGSYTSTFTANPFITYADKNQAAATCPTGNLTASSSTSATVTISSNCNISTTALNFGTTGLLASNIDASGTISAQCNNTLPYSIGLDNGSNASGSQRRMKQGSSNFVNYNLYTDTGRTSAWTTTTSTTSCTGGTGTCVTNTGTGASQNITVYGRVPSQSNPPQGTYSDTVLVTITF